MKKLLAGLILGLSTLIASAQSHVFPATDTNNTFTGTNTFNGKLTIGGGIGGLTLYGSGAPTATCSPTSIYFGLYYVNTANNNALYQCDGANSLWRLIGAGFTFPPSGLAKSTGSAWATPSYTDVVSLWTSCTSGYLAFDGTCSTPAGGSGGTPFSPTQYHVFTGDSLGIVEEADTSGGTITGASCNGTTCQWNDTNPSWYWVGKWVTFPSAIYGFPSGQWGCLGDVMAQIQSIVGNTITISESQGVYPGRTGCTGTQTISTTSVVQNQSNIYPQYAMSLPTYTRGGTITPVLYNRNWPAVALSDLDTNFTTYFNDVCPNTSGHASDFFIFSDDQTMSAATYDTTMRDLLGKAHACGFSPVIVGTLPQGPTPGSVADFYDTNDHIRAMGCNAHQTDGKCADRVVDTYAFGVNERLNSIWVQQGALSPHLTNAGGHRLAHVIADSFALNADHALVGAAGYGQNQFLEQQNFRAAAVFGSATAPQVTLDTDASHTWFHNYFNFAHNTNYYTVLPKETPFCFTRNGTGSGGLANNSPTVCLSAAADIGDGLSVGANSNPAQGDFNGNLELSGISMPNTITNGSTACNHANLWSFDPSGFLHICDGTHWQAPAGIPVGTIPSFPSSPASGIFKYTSTSAGVAATQTDISSVGYIADTGVADAYVATLSPAITSYTTGLLVRVKIANNNATTTPTLNVNGLGVKTIVKNGAAALVAGDIAAGQIQIFQYDGTNFQLLDPATVVNAVAPSSPITASIVAGVLNVACPTCGTSSSTAVNMNGGTTLGTLQITGNTTQACSDTSGSGTAQTCNTTTSFTPWTNSCVVYTTTTTNSGTGLTVNVNSLGAKSIAIPGLSGWTTTLTASIIPANKPLTMCYDGTNWNVQQTGTAASGGGPAAFSAITITSNTGTLATGGAAVTNGTATLSHLATTTINVSGLANGSMFNIKLTQDATGGNVLSLGTGCTWLAGSNAGFVASTTPALTAAANGVNVLSAIYDGTNCLYNVR